MANWEKCYARKRKPEGRKDAGHYWTCYKKKGHHLLSGDKAKHVDNKQTPPHYWEWNVTCTQDNCTELVDPYTTHYEPDALQLCDLHYSEYLDGMYATD